LKTLWLFGLIFIGLFSTTSGKFVPAIQLDVFVSSDQMTCAAPSCDLSLSARRRLRSRVVAVRHAAFHSAALKQLVDISGRQHATTTYDRGSLIMLRPRPYIISLNALVCSIGEFGSCVDLATTACTSTVAAAFVDHDEDVSINALAIASPAVSAVACCAHDACSDSPAYYCADAPADACAFALVSRADAHMCATFDAEELAVPLEVDSNSAAAPLACAFYFNGNDNNVFDCSGDNGTFGHLAPVGQNNFVELVEHQALNQLADMTYGHDSDLHNSNDNDDYLNDNDDIDNDDFDGSIDNGIFGLLAPMGQNNLVELADLSKLADLTGDFGLTAQADAADACLDNLLNFISLESCCNPVGDDFVFDTPNTDNSMKDVCPRVWGWGDVALILGERERLCDSAPDDDCDSETEELTDLGHDVSDSVVLIDACRVGVRDDSEPVTDELADLGQEVVVSLENFADLGHDVVDSLENFVVAFIGDRFSRLFVDSERLVCGDLFAYEVLADFRVCLRGACCRLLPSIRQFLLCEELQRTLADLLADTANSIQAHLRVVSSADECRAYYNGTLSDLADTLVDSFNSCAVVPVCAAQANLDEEHPDLDSLPWCAFDPFEDLENPDLDWLADVALLMPGGDDERHADYDNPDLDAFDWWLEAFFVASARADACLDELLNFISLEICCVPVVVSVCVAAPVVNMAPTFPTTPLRSNATKARPATPSMPRKHIGSEYSQEAWQTLTRDEHFRILELRLGRSLGVVNDSMYSAVIQDAGWKLSCTELEVIFSSDDDWYG